MTRRIVLIFLALFALGATACDTPMGIPPHEKVTVIQP